MPSHIESLPGKRWALDRTTKCGIDGFMRPCQMGTTDNSSGHPNAEVCRTDSEIVYVVDDYDDFRAELSKMLLNAGYAVDAKESVYDLCKDVGLAKTGCILLDLQLPGMSGLDYQDWANANGIDLPIVFITGQSDIRSVVRAMKYGAADFFVKPFEEMPLRQAINIAIARSRKNYCREQSVKLSLDLLEKLTPTELLVAQKVADGYPTKLIATKMDRSENTVKIHKHRIFNKLQVNSAASVAHIVDLAKGAINYNF